MNIIYFHSHDTGRLIEPYGHPVPAPEYTKLAASGILFRQAYAVSPTCSPSRSALLTGMAPHSNGMLGLQHFHFSLTHPERHLASFLRDQGYDTVLSGVQHEGDHDNVASIGYDINLNAFNRQKGATEQDLESARLACDYIYNREKGKPYFLSLGLFNTHRAGHSFPRYEQSAVSSDYVTPPGTLPDHPDVREDMARYIESAGVMDSALGLLMEALYASGDIDHTLVICTTDHGIAFPGMKGQLYDAGIGVSLIMKFPDHCGFPKGKAEEALVSHLDLYPTICDWIGVPRPSWLQGTSLLPLLRGETVSTNPCIFAETNYHVAYEPRRCVRTERYKLIRSYGPDERQVLFNIDDSPSKDLWMKCGMADRSIPREMLFDLYTDPCERENLTGDERYTTIHSELSQQLDEWMQHTSDPLLHGEVPLPPGAKTKNRSIVSPSDPSWEDTEEGSKKDA